MASKTRQAATPTARARADPEVLKVHLAGEEAVGLPGLLLDELAQALARDVAGEEVVDRLPVLVLAGGGAAGPGGARPSAPKAAANARSGREGPSWRRVTSKDDANHGRSAEMTSRGGPTVDAHGLSAGHRPPRSPSRSRLAAAAGPPREGRQRVPQHLAEGLRLLGHRGPRPAPRVASRPGADGRPRAWDRRPGRRSPCSSWDSSGGDRGQPLARGAYGGIARLFGGRPAAEAVAEDQLQGGP